MRVTVLKILRSLMNEEADLPSTFEEERNGHLVTVTYGSQRPLTFKDEEKKKKHNFNLRNGCAKRRVEKNPTFCFFQLLLITLSLKVNFLKLPIPLIYLSPTLVPTSYLQPNALNVSSIQEERT
jgi:hypothetical protein